MGLLAKLIRTKSSYQAMHVWQETDSGSHDLYAALLWCPEVSAPCNICWACHADGMGLSVNVDLENALCLQDYG